jgi:hypothetical protein
MKKIICLIFVGITLGCAQAQLLTAHANKWKATLKVVDETGKPVAGATATVDYLEDSQFTGLTDTNGIFIASHRDKTFALAFDVKKDGYYPFWQRYEMGFDYQYKEAKWNPTETIVLEKIGKPIPMYARNSQIEIPEINKPIGFDLVEYDWVSPYGKGKQADFIFQAERRWVSRNDFDCTIKLTFSNKGDGQIVAPASPFQGSSGPRMPVTAPLDGYMPEIQNRLSNTPANGWKDDSKDQNHFFRIRTMLDENGNVRSALYGKFYGNFSLDPINSKTTWILFTYYLNPTPNDRNLEFDPKHNLSTNLKLLEGVEAP